MNQTGSLDITVGITALNREAAGGAFQHLANPEVAQFTAVVAPEFGGGIAVAVIGVTMAGTIMAWRIKK